jgi:radical SAM/Cys-rich protein
MFIRRMLSTRKSLIPATLQGMENDIEFQRSAQLLASVGQKRLTLEERKLRRRALNLINIPSFQIFLSNHNLLLNRLPTKILQLNVTRYCNQACNHCHVESSPKRTEFMTNEVFDQCLKLLKSSTTITTIDLTGGAPELHPNFRDFIRKIRSISPDVEIIDRCNLTVLLEPGQEDLAEFLQQHTVRIIASLPCYSEKNVNLQRGRGVFSRSITALQMLNSCGYGTKESPLQLDLVYNPGGAFLPPNQHDLEQEYKEKLKADFGISFNNLFTLTNMPIKRFADMLHKADKMEEYMNLLVNNFNPSAVGSVMCRDTLSVGHDGKIFDCDFNQQLDLGVGELQGSTALSESIEDVNPIRQSSQLTIFDLESTQSLVDHEISLDLHCFGCTAGSGSSCQGATTGKAK